MKTSSVRAANVRVRGAGGAGVEGLVEEYLNTHLYVSHALLFRSPNIYINDDTCSVYLIVTVKVKENSRCDNTYPNTFLPGIF